MNRRNLLKVFLLAPILPILTTKNVVSSEFVINEKTLFNTHLQSLEISSKLTRDELYELGEKPPYHRFMNFPTKIINFV